MMYGAKCCAIKGQHIQKMSVLEMQMLHWIYYHTRRDRIRNDDIRDNFRVAQIQEKLLHYDIQQMPPVIPIHNDILTF
jgi:hypothetical protein